MKPQRVYSALLRLYPSAFRTRYGREIVETIAELRRTSPGTGLRLWVFLCSDVCCAAANQHIDLLKDRFRPTVKWIVACTAGAVAWKTVGSAIAWAFAYLYHPYLEGAALSPWLYGATLGAALGSAQCVVLRQLPRAAWILSTAAFAAVGLEVAVGADALASPLMIGVIVGVVIAAGQWLVLRSRSNRSVRLAPAAVVVLSLIAVSLSVARDRAPLIATSLNHYVLRLDPSPMSPLHQLFAPMNIGEWTIGLITIAACGMVVGAITARPVFAMLVDARLVKSCS